MPYIITTNRYMDDPTAEFLPGAKPGIERRAVATLDEARALVPETDTPLDERGATYNMLDGTVIEVEHVAYNWVAGVAEDNGAELSEDASCAEILDAFNAQAVR